MSRAKVVVLCFLCAAHTSCYEADSSEPNRIDTGRRDRGSYFDAIIYNDVTNMLSEMENNGISPFYANVNEEDNDESTEDLLSEYQRYLDKAERQRQIYEEKNQRGKIFFVRNSPGFAINEYIQDDMHSDDAHTNMEALIPMKFKLNQNVNNLKADDDDLARSLHGENCIHKSSKFSTEAFDKNINYDKQLKYDKIHRYSQRDSAQKQIRSKEVYTTTDTRYEPRDNVLNIKIKVDLQLPNQENTQCMRHNKNNKERKEDNDKSMESKLLLKEQSPFFNYLLPLAIDIDKNGGFQSMQNSKKALSSNKTSVYRKRKPKNGMNNKKHRKKFVTLHNLKSNLKHRIYLPSSHHNITDNVTENEKNSKTEHLTPKKIVLETKASNLYINDIIPTTTGLPATLQTQKEHSLTESNATSNNTNNAIEETGKNEYGAETDNDVKYNSTDNMSIDQQKMYRRKRAIIINKYIN